MYLYLVHFDLFINSDYRFWFPGSFDVNLGTKVFLVLFKTNIGIVHLALNVLVKEISQNLLTLRRKMFELKISVSQIYRRNSVGRKYFQIIKYVVYLLNMSYILLNES